VLDFTRGNSPYALPFTVARAEAVNYEYENNQGVITLRALSTGKKAETIRITTLYGRIISVR
jgi:hypothetical protein